MRTNAKTTILGNKVVLVPYRKAHVPRYHDWMQSAELQELTASEPLTLQEEYDMQKSWLEDPDKCTFIVLDKDRFNETSSEIDSMVGDVNLFFNDQDDKYSAEVEIMIADPSARGKGFGKETTVLMIYYGITNLKIGRYTAKIGFSNTKSIQLFEKLGFKEESKSDYFKEVTLALPVTEEVKSFICEMAEHAQIKTEAHP